MTVAVAADAGASAPAASGLTDPFLPGSSVTPERIDMGVDYSGSGTLGAIARGVITFIDPGGWGSYGNYLQYKITDPASPLFGKTVYYAEGVTPASGLKVGDTVTPGQVIAKLIPGWHSGIEMGFAGSGPNSTYAEQYGGGYTEGEATGSGEQFSQLLKSLGAPSGSGPNALGAGYVEGPQGGTGPLGAGILGTLGNIVTAGPKAAIGLISGGASAGVDVVKALAGFVENPVHAVLTIVLVITGALLIYSGAGKLLGFESPVSSTARAATGKVSQAKAAAE